MYNGKCKRLSDIRMKYDPFNYPAAEREFENICKDVFEGKSKGCTYGQWEKGRRCEKGNDEIYKNKMEDADKIVAIQSYNIRANY